jgi:hypothetical protein
MDQAIHARWALVVFRDSSITAAAVKPRRPSCKVGAAHEVQNPVEVKVEQFPARELAQVAADGLESMSENL